MKTTCAALAAALFSVLLSGCAGMVSFSSNIPIFYGTTVDIANDSSHVLVVDVSGGDARQLFSGYAENAIEAGVLRLAPQGGRGKLRLRNWGTVTVSTVLAVRIYREADGGYIGTVYSRPIWVYPTQSSTAWWLLSDEILQGLMWEQRQAN